MQRMGKGGLIIYLQHIIQALQGRGGQSKLIAQAFQ